MEVRAELKYTEEHEWLKFDGNIVTLGITDFAQNSLGDVVYVELPEVGTVVDAGESIGNIESVKAVSEIYCPVAGEVIDINKTLEEEPETVNTEPYDNGWMVKIKVVLADVNDDDLMDEEAYAQMTEKKN